MNTIRPQGTLGSNSNRLATLAFHPPARYSIVWAETL